MPRTGWTAASPVAQVVSEFLQPRLAGAGDVLHQLRVMGYTLAYEQHPRDEADYRVLLPSDFRDGTRIAKLLDSLLRECLLHV